MESRNVVNCQSQNVCHGSKYQECFSLLKCPGCQGHRCPPKFFKIRNKIKVFLQNSEDTSKEHFCVLKWLVQGLFLPKTLSILNNLNLSLQAKITIVLNVEAKTSGYLKTKLWYEQLYMNMSPNNWWCSLLSVREIDDDILFSILSNHMQIKMCFPDHRGKQESGCCFLQLII